MCTQTSIRPIPNSTPSTTDVIVNMVDCCFTSCENRFPEDCAYVPDIDFLYQAVRGSGPDRDNPLTREEIVRHARCYHHALGTAAREFNERHRISMYKLVPMLQISERWVKQNIERKEAAALQGRLAKMRAFGVRLFGPKKPPQEKSWINHRELPATEFVRKTFEKLGRPVEEKPQPKHRVHKHVAKPERPADAPKRFGDERKKPEDKNQSRKQAKQNLKHQHA